MRPIVPSRSSSFPQLEAPTSCLAGRIASKTPEQAETSQAHDSMPSHQPQTPPHTLWLQDPTSACNWNLLLTCSNETRAKFRQISSQPPILHATSLCLMPIFHTRYVSTITFRVGSTLTYCLLPRTNTVVATSISAAGSPKASGKHSLSPICNVQKQINVATLGRTKTRDVGSQLRCKQRGYLRFKAWINKKRLCSHVQTRAPALMAK